jgi:hypothetical protein
LPPKIHFTLGLRYGKFLMADQHSGRENKYGRSCSLCQSGKSSLSKDSGSRFGVVKLHDS